MPRTLPFLHALLVGLALPTCADVTRVATPPRAGINAAYPGNRAPLRPEPLVRLAPGAVRAGGWLATQVRLELDGMVGHLEEVSPWCVYSTSAWTARDGKGRQGWEELPYWLKGYAALAYVSGDRTAIANARKWIDAILASQRPDGYFGPEQNRGQVDVWPNMLALWALRTHADATGDARVVPFMQRYFRWMAAQPDARFLPGSWQKQRGADNLEVIYWLYGKTGEPWLLDLAERNHRRTDDWTSHVASWHGVNMAQGWRGPAQYWQQSGDPRFLAASVRNYNEMRQKFGQVPGGMYGADENVRAGYTGPRQGTETCAFVEMMYSHEELARITGDTLWADRCEDVAFNSFPASMTPDLKALHYLTAPNQVQLDQSNKSPMVQNGGDMMSYSPYEKYRCCQHNVGFGWPYFVQNLWAATRDNGLAALLYAPSSVTARVAGADVRVSLATTYPFSDALRFRVQASARTRFPLYLRVPGWCAAPTVAINGKPARGAGRGGWIRIERPWRTGDGVDLRLPMRITTTTWKGNRNTVSVNRGPLTYSLRISEEWSRYADNKRPWACWEARPGSPWNYGLVIDPANPGNSVRVVPANWGRIRPGVGRYGFPVPGGQPFEANSAPVALVATARRIPEWKQEANGMVGEVRAGPIRSASRLEQVSLIPMGCARLRITAFPRIGSGPAARDWGQEGPGPRASFCCPFDTISALDDGLVPKSSNDQSVPRFTWWDHRGGVEWISNEYAKPTQVGWTEVYWFDDEPTGECRVPASWRVLWYDGKEWRPVEGAAAAGVARNRFNRVTFKPVAARGIRVEVELQSKYSGGVLEWRTGK